ncbi:MAG: ParA family protein, partial [Gemmatimonadota bacterium]
GVRKGEDDLSVYDCLVDGRPMSEATRREVHFPHLDVVPASRDLVGAEVELVDRPSREKVLRHSLEEVKGEYDYVL